MPQAGTTGLDTKNHIIFALYFLPRASAATSASYVISGDTANGILSIKLPGPLAVTATLIFRLLELYLGLLQHFRY